MVWLTGNRPFERSLDEASCLQAAVQTSDLLSSEAQEPEPSSHVTMTGSCKSVRERRGLLCCHICRGPRTCGCFYKLGVLFVGVFVFLWGQCYGPTCFETLLWKNRKVKGGRLQRARKKSKRTECDVLCSGLCLIPDVNYFYVAASTENYLFCRRRVGRTSVCLQVSQVFRAERDSGFLWQIIRSQGFTKAFGLKVRGDLPSSELVSEMAAFLRILA